MKIHAVCFRLGTLWAALVFSSTFAAFAQEKKDSVDSKLPAVHLDGGYFSANGKRFVPVGAHWVPAKAAMQWNVDWDPKDIEADFAKMHELGYSIVRFDIMWPWFEPRPGDYNPVAFQQLDFLASLAHKYKIYLHPSLFVGGEVGEAYWDVPWRMGRHPHADPEMLRLEANLAAEFGRRYANETAIIGWDLTDEPPFWIVPQTDDAMAINWTHLIAGGIRENDKLHPIVVGTSGQEISHGPFRADNIAKFVDFFSVHPFTLYSPDLFPDALLSARGTYGAAFEITLSQGAGHPVMIHEMGGSTAQFSPEHVAAYDRAQIYSGLGAGSIGVDLWCYTDASPEQFRKAPYLRTPQETGWGMTTWDRQDKPLAREFKKISQLVSRLDLSGISPAPAEVAIVIPDEWSKPHGDYSKFGLTGPAVTPYLSQFDAGATPGRLPPDGTGANLWLMSSALTSFILARQVGLKADFPREYGDWEKRPILFMPSPITSTSDPFLAHVHSDFYEKARKYVEKGGFLYASVASDGAVPEMTSLFGARIIDRAISSEVTIKFTEPFGNLKPGDTFHFTVPSQSIQSWGVILEVSSGKVIAVDQNGRPALVTNTIGAGKTLLSAYPIEHYLAGIPAVFDQPESTHRIYEAFREWTGIKPQFRSDRPEIEVSPLTAGHRGYLVVVNHSAQAQDSVISAAVPIASLSMVTPDGVESVELRDSKAKLHLGPFEGAVLEWKK